jgi:hypothetical protein
MSAKQIEISSLEAPETPIYGQLSLRLYEDRSRNVDNAPQPQDQALYDPHMEQRASERAHATCSMRMKTNRLTGHEPRSQG